MGLNTCAREPTYKADLFADNGKQRIVLHSIVSGQEIAGEIHDTQEETLCLLRTDNGPDLSYRHHGIVLFNHLSATMEQMEAVRFARLSLAADIRLKSERLFSLERSEVKHSASTAAALARTNRFP
jgi:hypothetical protein